MSQATKQVTKQVTKQSGKAKAKQEPKASAAPLSFYASLYSAIIAKKLGDKVFAYYRRAAEYHKAQRTVFPRAANNAMRAELFGASVSADKAKANAEAIITRCTAGTLSSGHRDGQALYDAMRMDADAAGIVWPLTK